MERSYLIVESSEASMFDYSLLIDSEFELLKTSRDGSKVVIRWDGVTPEFVHALATKSEILTRDQILPIMSTIEWAGDGQEPCTTC